MAGPRAESQAEVMGRHDHPDVLGGQRLTVSVVTPRGAILARQVDEVTGPGASGDFGVLPGHVPFLAALRPGILSLRDGQQRDVLAVSSGYAQVGARNHVKILVENAQSADEIDIADARRSFDQASEELKSGKTGGELRTLQAQLDWARARIEAHGLSRGKVQA
ncbi:MAG: ATP synthase F1 subunit epsilon [Deltaproteobacteria bacterium]|nr:ATP synthase F1 subunit epsilon [Deltaproteobacteria bacterium]